MDEIQRLAIETINNKKQVIIFTPSRASAEKTAEDISKLTNFQHPEMENEVLKAASSPTKQCRRLSHCIKKGIAFHHAGLVQKQKDLIEDEFRSGKVKVICCTPTLAAGMSLPAFRVIIKSLKRYSGRWGMDWIPVLEYMQMAGRAGRPEYESFGEAIVVAKTEKEKEEIHERYVLGEPEDIYSKLAVEPVLRTYLLSLIASGIIRDEKAMKDFFSKTFWASQFRDFAKLELIMEKMLSILDKWGFVNISGAKRINEDFITASDINKEGQEIKKLQATLIGKRISELYLDPLTARHLLDCLVQYDETKNAFSLLQMISNTLEMRPLLRIKSKEEDYVQEQLVKNYDSLLEKEPSTFDLEYPDFMNSIKTALFFEAWTDEKDEDFLLEKYNIRPGEIRVKIEIADWLLYACTELAKISGFSRELIKELNKLRVRVKNGVKEDLLIFLKLKGVGRVRARKLVLNGMKDLGDLKKTDLTSLAQILGSKLAVDVYKQLGLEVKEIPKGTRKGQLALQKFQ
jgi:helicase